MGKKTIGILFLSFFMPVWANNDFFYEKLEKLQKQNEGYVGHIQHLHQKHAEEIRRLKQNIKKAQRKTEFLDEWTALMTILETLSSETEENLPEVLENLEDFWIISFYKSSGEGQLSSLVITPIMRIPRLLIYLTYHLPPERKDDHFSLQKLFMENHGKKKMSASKKHKEEPMHPFLTFDVHSFSLSMPRKIPIFETEYVKIDYSPPKKVFWDEEGCVHPSLSPPALSGLDDLVDQEGEGVNNIYLEIEGEEPDHLKNIRLHPPALNNERETEDIF